MSFTIHDHMGILMGEGRNQINRKKETNLQANVRFSMKFSFSKNYIYDKGELMYVDRSFFNSICIISLSVNQLVSCLINWSENVCEHIRRARPLSLSYHSVLMQWCIMFFVAFITHLPIWSIWLQRCMWVWAWYLLEGECVRVSSWDRTIIDDLKHFFHYVWPLVEIVLE